MNNKYHTIEVNENLFLNFSPHIINLDLNLYNLNNNII